MDACVRFSAAACGTSIWLLEKTWKYAEVVNFGAKNES